MLRWKPVKDLFVNDRQIIEPQVSVPETKYALVPDQVKLSPAFYHNEDNCVSFCLSMILAAYPKSALNQILLGIPWFESQIKKH
jgi:hypothetical protein